MSILFIFAFAFVSMFTVPMICSGVMLLESFMETTENFTLVVEEIVRTIENLGDLAVGRSLHMNASENEDEDLDGPGFQDFLERLSDVGVGYIIRELYTASITEDNEIRTVLGVLGRFGVSAYIIGNLGKSQIFDPLTSRSLRRLSRYMGVGITLVGSYFDLYLLFDSIGCLVRRRALEQATGLELEFTSSIKEEPRKQFVVRKPGPPLSVFCKREHPILEIIAACIATVADSVTFVTPQNGEAGALVETLWQVVAFYYVAAEKRITVKDDHDLSNEE